MSSHFRSSCARAGYFARTGERCNHVLLDGGRLHVEDHQLSAFRALYNRCFFANEPLYVVERVSLPVFPFFADLDIASGARPMHAADRDFLVDVIYARLRRTHDVRSPMVVCVASRPKTKREMFYDGIHLHWPELLVTRETALRLRNSIVRGLSAAVGAECMDWPNVVDAAVYRTGSLRMKGSRKCDDDVHRYYWPIKIYEADHHEHGGAPWSVDYDADAIRLCSVRAPPDTVATTSLRFDPEDEKDDDDDDDIDDVSSVTTSTTTGHDRVGESSSSYATTTTMGRLRVVTTRNTDLVTSLLLRRFGTDYKLRGVDTSSFRVTNVVVFARSAVVHVNKAWRFCFNKNGAHGSSIVYFHIDLESQGMYQRCFSHKVYHGVACSAYTGFRRPLAPELVRLIWSSSHVPPTTTTEEDRRVPSVVPPSVSKSTQNYVAREDVDIQQVAALLLTRFPEHRRRAERFRVRAVTSCATHALVHMEPGCPCLNAAAHLSTSEEDVFTVTFRVDRHYVCQSGCSHSACVETEFRGPNRPVPVGLRHLLFGD